MSSGGTESTQVPQTLVGLSFESAFRAQEFLTAATGLAAKGELKLRDAVLVTKDHDGKTMVHETADLQPGRSALSGAVWAGLFGLILGGPVGWVAGLALGVSDEWVAWFRDTVAPDTVTLVLLVEDVDRDALVTEAKRFTGAELVYANLDDETIKRVEAALES